MTYVKQRKACLKGKRSQQGPDVRWEVTVYELRNADKSVNMLFCFEKMNGLYYPAVNKDDDKLQIMKRCSDPKERSDFEEQFLFKWVETTGQWRSLRSVARPNSYLCIIDKRLGISNQPQANFRLEFIKRRT